MSPGSGPPVHVHHPQEEVLTVEQGTMAWQRLGEEENLARSGESARFAPGEVHRFLERRRRRADLHRLRPVNLEYFLTQVFASTRANGGKRPRLFDAAFLLSRYRSEFGMADIPAPVQRLAFPIVVGIGGLLGLRRRFAGAPEPVSRPR